VDDLAAANGVGNFGQVADVGGRVGVEDDEIGVQSLLHASFVGGFEIGGGIGCERSENLGDGQRAMHQFVFQRSIVDGREADVGAEKNGAAVGGESLELVDAGLHHMGGGDRVRKD